MVTTQIWESRPEESDPRLDWQLSMPSVSPCHRRRGLPWLRCEWRMFAKSLSHINWLPKRTSVNRFLRRPTEISLHMTVHRVCEGYLMFLISQSTTIRKSLFMSLSKFIQSSPWWISCRQCEQYFSLSFQDPTEISQQMMVKKNMIQYLKIKELGICHAQSSCIFAHPKMVFYFSPRW